METGKRPWRWEEDGTEVVRSIARTAPGCHSGCGVLLYVKDKTLIKVEGNPDFPFNQGRLCPRCQVLPQVVYNRDRITYPMRRIRAKGEVSWKRISWEEAFEIIASNLLDIKEKLGPESVIFCTGTARDLPYWIQRLAHSYGSPNTTCWGPLYGAACYRPKVVLQRLMMGERAVADCSQFFPDRYDNAEWKRPECILVWGNNPVVSSADGISGPWIVEGLKLGSKLIVVDPRKTWLASRADVWMQIRPGTDGALGLGLLNVIINEGLYDKQFVKEWTYGFEKLREKVKEYPPERVAEITWIPKDQIVKAAKLYAQSKPASVQWGVALDQSKECIPTLQAIVALWSVTGNLDVPGGNVIYTGIQGMPTLGKMSKELSEKTMSSPFPLSPNDGQHVIDQMLEGKPYPIKAAWIQGTNTFVTEADPKRVYKAFSQISFNVVVDLFMTPTAEAFADIVLPAATYAERDGLTIEPPPLPYVGTINKAIEPVGESKSDMELILEMGRRLNPQAWPWEDVHGWYNHILQPLGITFEKLREKGWIYAPFHYRKHENGLLRPDGEPGFNTPTGKVELYCTSLKKAGLDPLPYYEEPPESPVRTPDFSKDYPLILTTGAKVYAFFHSEQRQVPLLRQLNPDPIVEIHPDTAKELGIRDGEWVCIENRYGRCKQKARLTPDIDRQVVSAQHGWWYPEKPPSELYGAWESNIGLLIPPGWTGRSGYGYPFKNLLCKIYKA
ncbi:MAG: molybdopterin-dependent oxidoreductase [Deltaproteobacteria bacterium]|nr:molybdopterin-dependent oxidoreductase [Deltaproteobacteria bacterium]